MDLAAVAACRQQGDFRRSAAPDRGDAMGLRGGGSEWGYQEGRPVLSACNLDGDVAERLKAAVC